jgi:hypothetical protein
VFWWLYVMDYAHATHSMVLVADTRYCDQCGISFTPRREHARFCSAPCRLAWNRENTGDLRAEMNALDWSVAAMCDVTERLARVAARDRAQAFTVISEAVWWVTIVDATLMRYHPEVYEGVMGAQAPAERRRIEGTFAGLRFVRNRMGYYVDHADFIEPGGSRSGSDDGCITTWTWRSLPEPALALLPPRGQAWEMTRYRAYEAQLAGHTIGEIFGRAAVFLKLASAKATSVTAGSSYAGP